MIWIEWQEIGGPPIVLPKRLGFGSTLIKQALHYEFDVHVTWTFAPTGLLCVMILPFTKEVARAARMAGDK